MKVLMISSDRNILTPNSAVSARMKEYAGLVEELHIVLLSDSSHGLKEAQIGKSVWVYPTNSSIKFLRPMDAARIGKRIVFEKNFVRGRSVITADSFECGWAAMKVKAKWRIPFELQIHTDPFSPYFSGFQNSVRKFFARNILAKADSIRVVSENLKRSIENLLEIENWKLKINVLPIYVDRQNIESAPITFDAHARYGWSFVLLSVARLEPEKNLSLALETLALVRKQFPDTGLVIVGSGSEEGRLRGLVGELNLEGFVEFAGWQEALGSYYKTANIFLQTSHFEGYGLALVEAGLSGLPVVTTPVGLALELENGKDAYICADGDAGAFAGAIVDLIEHNLKRENLKLNLKQTLEGKLIAKDEYLERMKKGWEECASRVGQ
ncbi:MAG: glycosyltransferase [Patescibacteria group bacterium]